MIETLRYHHESSLSNIEELDSRTCFEVFCQRLMSLKRLNSRFFLTWVQYCEQLIMFNKWIKSFSI